jgi:thiol-disulfide isomerase/thioredoxin
MMRWITRRPACTLGLILLWGSSAIAADELFRDMSLDQAKQLAAKDGKSFLLVDIYTVWCEPCKKLDETTWKDAEVRKWLSAQAVCLKIDAEKQVHLAEKYRVNAYPTVLLLKPDGGEIDRLVGYRDAKTFLADARESLAGNDTLSRARKMLEGEGRNSPMLRQQYGDALVQKGRLEDALSEYLWCFDHGLEHDSSYAGVRLSFLLSRIAQLGQTLPNAVDELRNRRDAARKSIEAGKAELQTAMSFTSLNDYLKEPEDTLALYDRIKGEKGQPVAVLWYLQQQSIDQLLSAKRYRDVVSLGGSTKVRELIRQYEAMEARIPEGPGIREYMKKQVAKDGAKYYEALVGAKESEEAADVAARLTAFDPDAYPVLIAAAKRAGDEATAEALAKKAKKVAAKPPND